jgi:energy-coupling factor transporter ATP-binding protein EcfA2
MILRFGVENFRSFRDRAELSFVSTARKDEPALRFPTSGTPHGVLPVVGLWGANASGKSNLLAALVGMQNAVAMSFVGLSPDQEVPWIPWRMMTAMGAPPTKMDLDILVGGVRHHYGFRFDSRGFSEEWLYAWPGRARRVLFHRNHADADPWYFGPSLKDARRIVKATRPNSLFLSAAAQHNHKSLKSVYGAITGGLIAVPALKSEGHPLFRPGSAILDPGNRTMLLAALAAADLDVRSVREVERHDETVLLKVQQSLTRDPQLASLVAELDSTGPLRELWFTHGASGESGWEVPPPLESRGTHAFLHRFDVLLQILSDGVLWIADELDQSLHPDLCRELIRLFTDPATNRHGAQLLFATHQRDLLTTLRTDEVLLVEKDRDGASSLRAASDFRELRTRDDLRRAHEQGRVGGVPVLGDLGAALSGSGSVS